MPRLRLYHQDIEGEARAGCTLLQAARDLGHALEQDCGGKAECGSCCVVVVEGERLLAPPGRSETRQLAALGLSHPHRLACQAILREGSEEVAIVAC